MPSYQSPTPARGDEDLPDLAINMPLPQWQPHPEITGMLATDLLRQQHLPSYEIAPDTRKDGSVNDDVRAKHHRASAAVDPKARHGGGFHLGHQGKARHQDSAAWPGRESSTSASCSKWSLACIHAAALNAFDEHDSDSDDRHAARALQRQRQRKGRQNARKVPEMASSSSSSSSSHHPRHHEHHQGDTRLMLQCWFNQSPRQEGFHGVATAEASSPGGTMASRL
jgi:hypothetical protein